MGAVMRPICTNLGDFEALRKAGQLYVDKTAHFHRLITDPSRTYFFIARPRRFGKSLGVTTLKSIFLGRREFFDGLAISRTDYDWKPHAVIHFNWGGVDASSLEKFDATFPNAVERALVAAGAAYDRKLEPSVNLAKAIEFLYAKDGVGPAVLIDEYDDPVAKSLADPDRAEAIRDRLASIYAQFKDNSGKIRFLFITGVSKFTKLSIFSTLSNLNDITFEDTYAEMFGYTEEELDANFDGYLRLHAEKMKLGYDDYRAELKRWFNGYRFARKDPVTVYNPVAINLTLYGCDDEFRGTWTETGRPSMLMNFIRREGLLALDYEKGIRAIDSDFDVSDIRNLRTVAMLYQTGYLTIADYEDGDYLLKVPDEEVRRDLMLLVAAQSAQEDESWVGALGSNLRRGEFGLFFRGLKSLYAHLPYGSTEGRIHEMSYERALLPLFRSQGFDVVCEDFQATGRSDLTVKLRRSICIFELKVDESAAAAIGQIKANGYAKPYLADGRPIWLLGLNFDSKTRQLVDCAVERLENTIAS